MLLISTKAHEWKGNPIYTEYDREYIEGFYKFEGPDTGRRYQKGDLTAAKPGSDTSYEWWVKRAKGQEWQADLDDEWKSPFQAGSTRAFPRTGGAYWAYSKEWMCEFALSGRLVYAKTGMPRYKRYLDEMAREPLQDIWTDIRPAGKAERLTYPTQ